MNRIRISLATLAFAAAGLAHAGEISERPQPMSAKSRTLVAAEARTATPTNEIWDGREDRAGTMVSMKSRADVKAEAARTKPSQIAMRDFVGGM